VAIIAHDELNAQLAQAEATLSASAAQTVQVETQLANAKTTLERVRDLLKAGSATQQQLDDRQSQYDVLVAQLNAVRQSGLAAAAQVNYVKAQLANTTLNSPIDGIVLKRNAEPGEVVSSGTAVVTIGDLARPWLKIYLAGPQLGGVKLSAPARVSVDAFPGKTFIGKVSRIAEQAEFTPRNVQTRDERTRLVYAVRIALDNPAGELKPGMPADAVIEP
jgi:HlyD family secretion protein